jgi:hypothetical protein
LCRWQGARSAAGSASTCVLNALLVVLVSALTPTVGIVNPTLLVLYADVAVAVPFGVTSSINNV